MTGLRWQPAMMIATVAMNTVIATVMRWLTDNKRLVLISAVWLVLGISVLRRVGILGLTRPESLDGTRLAIAILLLAFGLSLTLPAL